MESEVQEASPVPRSELDAAFRVSGATGWLVVQSVPTAPWGYELWPEDGKAGAYDNYRLRAHLTPSYPGRLGFALELQKDR